MMKKVLITGLTGRIGPSFLSEYSSTYNSNYDLTVGINKTKLDGDYKTVKINLANLDELTKTFSGFDIVVNLAANSDPASDFESLVQPNLVGTYNLLEAARRSGVKRVILASSVHVMRGYPLGKTIKMNEVPKPLNYYGATKAFLEAMCHVYAYTYGLSCFAIRIGAYISDDLLKNACPTRNNFDYIISQRDFAQLVYKAIVAPFDLKYAVLAGSSKNTNNFMDLEETKKLIGYDPKDNGYDMCKPHIIGKI